MAFQILLDYRHARGRPDAVRPGLYHAVQGAEVAYHSCRLYAALTGDRFLQETDILDRGPARPEPGRGLHDPGAGFGDHERRGGLLLVGQVAGLYNHLVLETRGEDHDLFYLPGRKVPFARFV